VQRDTEQQPTNRDQSETKAEFFRRRQRPDRCDESGENRAGRVLGGKGQASGETSDGGKRASPLLVRPNSPTKINGEQGKESGEGIDDHIGRKQNERGAQGG